MRLNLKPFEKLIYYNLHEGNAELTIDNHLEIFTDGAGFYESLKAEIENASEYVYILSYIVKPDEVLEGFEDLLEEKAAQGLEVRLLTDAVGSRHMKVSDYQRIRKKGIRTAVFRSVWCGTIRSRIHYRNHRKIIVIDGRIGYVGGFNFAREYLGLDQKIGYWRDTHIKIQGTAVQSLNRRFVQDWKYTTKEWSGLPVKKKRKEESMRVKIPEKGQVAMQIVSSGPDCRWRHIRNNYIQLFGLAEKYIYIQTPYFVPDEPTLYALRMAALSGVDVRVMLPCKPDHVLVYWASTSFAAGLLEAGARCYTYDNGFLHAKGVVVDGRVCCYGTANMDMRSFYLNFEVNAVIYDEKTAAQMEAIFLEDLKQCTELTKKLYGQRKRGVRIKENLARMLAPIL